MDVLDINKSRLPMLRRKLIMMGLTQEEILEFLLLSICDIQNAKEKSENVIKKYSSINAFLNSDIKTISSDLDIKLDSASFLFYFPKLIKHYSFTAEKHILQINSNAELIEYLIDNVKDSNFEQFFIVYMNPRGAILHSRKIRSLSATKVVIAVDDLVCEARSLCAASCAISHSHPRGVLEPSIRDGTFTKLLYMSLIFSNIQLLDHIITDSESYYSFREHGIIKSYEKIARTEFGVFVED